MYSGLARIASIAQELLPQRGSDVILIRAAAAAPTLPGLIRSTGSGVCPATSCQSWNQDEDYCNLSRSCSTIAASMLPALNHQLVS